MPEEERAGIYRLIKLQFFLTLLAPAALAVYMWVQEINKYAIEWSAKGMKIAYSLGTICALTIIVELIIMFFIIQKTLQHLKDVGFRREVLDPNVLRNIYFLLAGLVFVLISVIVGLIMRIKAAHGDFDSENAAKMVLMLMTIATFLFSIA